MMRTVKNWEMQAAARSAMLMDNSMVIRRATMFSAASLKIGQPPIRMPNTPTRLTLRKGSHLCDQTAAAASATRIIRAASTQPKTWLLWCSSAAGTIVPSCA